MDLIFLCCSFRTVSVPLLITVCYRLYLIEVEIAPCELITLLEFDNLQRDSLYFIRDDHDEPLVTSICTGIMEYSIPGLEKCRKIPRPSRLASANSEGARKSEPLNYESAEWERTRANRFHGLFLRATPRERERERASRPSQMFRLPCPLLFIRPGSALITIFVATARRRRSTSTLARARLTNAVIIAREPNGYWWVSLLFLARVIYFASGNPDASSRLIL